jgi:hypothetical protein
MSNISSVSTVKHTIERQIPVVKPPWRNPTKSSFMKNSELRKIPTNEKPTLPVIEISLVTPLESPMGKHDDMGPLEEFEHPIINEKYTNTQIKAPDSVNNENNTIAVLTEVKPKIPTQLDNSTAKSKNNSTTNTISEENANVATGPLRDRTESEDELIKETVMLFLSTEHDEFVLPGQTDALENLNKTESIRNSVNSYKVNSPPKSEITINKGILTLITEHMIVKVEANKLIGYIAGANNDSVILIFKKNNINVPIKNKSAFKTTIILLDEILSKKSWCFPFFSFY